METDPAENASPIQGEPKGSELEELTSEVRSAEKRVSRTIVYLFLGIVFGKILYAVISNVFFPSPTIHQRECAKFGIECSP